MKSIGMSRTIYLDYNATTPLAAEVIETIRSALDAWGNPSSKYEAGAKAKNLIVEARSNVAACISASPSDIIFTSGGSEANNWVVYSAIECFQTSMHSNSAEPHLKPHIVTSTVEHDSISAPLDALKKKGKIDLTKLPIDEETGDVRPDAVAAAIQANTCLVTIMTANNETGTIMPIKEIGQAVRLAEKRFSTNIFYHTDAAQTIGKVPVNVDELNVDFLTIVGHKFYGPRIGALYIKNLNEKSRFCPMIYGGGQEKGWRAGTENTPMIAGLGAAAKLVCDNLKEYRSRMQDTRDYLQTRMLEEFGKEKVVFNCKGKNILPNTCNVSIIGPGLEGFRIIEKAEDFCCSTGSACHSDKCTPSKVLLNFHVPDEVAANALRITTGRDTDRSDIDKVVAELSDIVNQLNDS